VVSSYLFANRQTFLRSGSDGKLGRLIEKSQSPPFLRRASDSKIAKLILQSESPPFLWRGRGGKYRSRRSK